MATDGPAALYVRLCLIAVAVRHYAAAALNLTEAP